MTQFKDANAVMDLMTAQRNLLLQWRDHIIALLTEKLSGRAGEEADGQEYARALDTQGEVEQYLQAYAALLADRREALKAERTALAAHESKVTKLRQTKAAARAAAIDIGPEDYIPPEAKPEHEVLRTQLAEARTSLRKDHKGQALKVNSSRLLLKCIKAPSQTMVVALNTMAVPLKDQDPEKEIAIKEATRLRGLMKDQG